MQIKCSFVSPIFDKPEVDFKIAKYRPESGEPLTDDFVAKGNSIPLDPFFIVTFEGAYFDDNKGWGPALYVKSYNTSVRKTRANVLGYLSSGVIKGIGPALAKDIVDTFGLDAVDILENNPYRLQEIKGIGEKTMLMILESFEENREIHGLMQYLGQFDISVNKARRIAKHYGTAALDVVKNDIFNLCAVDGFGFLTVDQIARKMNHPLNTLPRVKAAAIYTLEENRAEGHLYMEPEGFLKELRKLLNHDNKAYKLSEDELRPLANESIKDDKITYANQCLYLTKDYKAEKGFAELMARRLARDIQQTTGTIQYPQVVSKNIRLSKDQEKAVLMALTHNTCIITGGPGTGKTTVLRAFLDTYRKLHLKKDGILLCAPTGRAARRMSEATGYEAYTIHKAFLLDSENDNRGNSLKLDCLIIDEFSMADMWISYQVLSRISIDTKLVIVGDKDQLPSVGPGNVLRDLLRVKELPAFHLNQVFRQEEGSSIAENAQRINKRETELIYDDSFIFVPAQNQKEGKELICKLYHRAAKMLGADKVQILTPLRKRGECGANYLNAAIQIMVQGNPEKGKKIFDRYFCAGDPVIQNKNQAGVNNGDMGTVTETSSTSVKVEYPGLDMVRGYDDEALRILELAYALTVHKSQGAEYPVVIMPMLREHAFFLNRNLFYTAITRGKGRVVLVGSQYAIKRAILTEDMSKRRTNLANRIIFALNNVMNGDGKYEITDHDYKETA